MSFNSPNGSNIPSESDEIISSVYPKTESKLEITKLFKCSIKRWNYLMIFLNMCAILLVASSLVAPRWVEQGNTEHFWRGGLFKCSGCNGKFRGKYYSQIRKIACEDLKGYCETFTDLYIAGIFMIFGALLYFLMFITWTTLLLLENHGKDFQKKYFSVLVIGGPLSLIVFLSTWHAATGANYNSKCYSNWTTKDQTEHLCAIDGPIILLVSIFLSSLSSSLFFLIKFFSYESKLQKIQPYKLEDEN